MGMEQLHVTGRDMEAEFNYLNSSVCYLCFTRLFWGRFKAIPASFSFTVTFVYMSSLKLSGRYFKPGWV